MEYRKAGKELDEILALLREQVVNKHEDIIEQTREWNHHESGRILVEQMENVQGKLLHLAKRVEELSGEVVKAERSSRE
jgi:hypothetical protein